MATSSIDCALLKLKCIQEQWIQTVCIYFHLPASTLTFIQFLTFMVCGSLASSCVIPSSRKTLLPLSMSASNFTPLTREWCPTSMGHLKFTNFMEMTLIPTVRPFLPLVNILCCFQGHRASAFPSRMVDALREGTILHSFRWWTWSITECWNSTHVPVYFPI